MEHLKDLLQRDKFRAFYLYAVSLIHSIWDEGALREEGSREWAKNMILKPYISKLSFLPEGNRCVLKRPAPPFLWWPGGGLLWQIPVCPASRSPLLLSHVLLSPCAPLTVRVAAQWIAMPFGDHVKEGHRTSHCSAALTLSDCWMGHNGGRLGGNIMQRDISI